MKLENLKEKDDFLDSAKHSKLNQDINKLNIPIRNEKNETVIKSLPAKKVQDQIYLYQHSTTHSKKIYSQSL